MKYMFLLKAGEKPSFEKIEYKEEMDVSKRLDWYKDKIKCEWVEVVQLPHFLPMSCLIVDEEGLIKSDTPEINLIASVLYGTRQHGSPIAGNAILCTQIQGIEGIDTTGFDNETAGKIEILLNNMVRVAETEV